MIEVIAGPRGKATFSLVKWSMVKTHNTLTFRQIYSVVETESGQTARASSQFRCTSIPSRTKECQGENWRLTL